MTQRSEFPHQSKTLSYEDPAPYLAEVFGLPGVEQLQAIIDGRFPAPPIASHFGIEFLTVSVGEVLLAATPDASHYNPIGSIHGGFAATLLDSACGCAVQSTLPAGVGYTTLELKVSMLRGITRDTGRVTVHGWITKPGSRAAFAEADIRDSEGRVLATASSTCLVMAP